jgi:hypothetical protein
MKRITAIFCLLALTALAADVVVWDRATQTASWGVVDANNVVAIFTAAGGGEDTNQWALSYNKGENDCLYTSQDFTNLFSSTTASCTLLMWVNITDAGGDQEYGFFEMSRADPVNGAFIFEFIEGWGINALGVRLTSGGWSPATAGFAPTYDAWHLVGVVKSNNQYTFTIDAVNDSAKTINTASTAYGKLYIGDNDPSWGGRGFNGGLRKVWMWNRALAFSEVTNLYNAGVWTTNYPASGLVAYWPCNEGTGTNVADLIGGNIAHFGTGDAAPTWINWPQ